MRAFWSGEIAFGLVTIPAKLYTATKDLTPQFHQLHKECGTRINMVRRCPKCNRDLPWDEIGKGYEVAKGEYALFTKEELAKLDGDDTGGTIEIVEFVESARGRPRVRREELLGRPGQQERPRLSAPAHGARRREEGRARQGQDPHAHAPGAAPAPRAPLLARHDALRRGARGRRRDRAGRGQGVERAREAARPPPGRRAHRPVRPGQAPRRVPQRRPRRRRREGRSGRRRPGHDGRRSARPRRGAATGGAQVIDLAELLSRSIKVAAKPGPAKTKGGDETRPSEEKPEKGKSRSKKKRATG